MSPQIPPPPQRPLGNGVSVPSSPSAPQRCPHGRSPVSGEGRISGLLNTIQDRRRGPGTYAAAGDASRARQSAEDDQELAGYERGRALKPP